MDPHPTVPDITGQPLPAGWHEVRVPGVNWPLLVGPGGVVIVFTRSTTTGLPRPDHDHGGDHDDRRRTTSGAHLTAALAGHLLGLDPASEMRCTPVVALDDDRPLVARADDAAVVHRSGLVAWLCARPRVLDDDTIGRLVAAAPPR